VLLSVLPKYADAIMSGTKTVEFRKCAINGGTGNMVVYSSSPRKKVVGYLEIGKVDLAKPSTLWKRYWRSGGIDEVAFFKYYEGCATGACHVIYKVWRLDKPVAITKVGSRLRAPQSFLYLTPKQWDKIRGSSASLVLDQTHTT